MFHKFLLASALLVGGNCVPSPSYAHTYIDHDQFPVQPFDSGRRVPPVRPFRPWVPPVNPPWVPPVRDPWVIQPQPESPFWIHPDFFYDGANHSQYLKETR